MVTILKTQAGEEIALNIFSLRIHQKEGLKALCDIEIADLENFVLPETMDVWMDGTCQFRGQVTGMLKHFTPQTSKIELTQLCTPYQALPNEPLQFTTPHEHLPVLPCYDRLTGAMSETHLLQGKHVLTIDEKCVINYSSTKQPVPIGVDLCLEAKWRWQRVSFFDIWAEIKTQSGGEFATLTPAAFIQKWHTALQLSPQSGYQVIYNNLSVQKPRFSGTFGDKKRIKGGVIDGQCLIRATQEQKYHEIVHCSLGKNYTQRKRLHLKVPLIDCDTVQFFGTATGKLWFERAYAIAYNYFLACNRQTRITIEAALTPDILTQLTMDTQIAIGQRCSGKITGYTITETASGRLCQIVLCETHAQETMHAPTLPLPDAGVSVPQSFVHDMDLQNLFATQNSHALAHKTDSLKLPVTTVYLQLKDLVSKPTEPRIYRI